MAQISPGKAVDRPTLVVGVLLVVLAGITAWNARTLTSTSTYGMGPEAMPYVIAIGLVLLAIGHFVMAFRSALPAREELDPIAIAWIAIGLAALIALIGFGAGFIPAMAVLFASTARAFGRRAFLVDLAIGFVLGFIVYMMFTKLLTLALPEGPLERFL
jgi:putative tricarboxylic transport membrane protein